jgi:hypothetical protein
MDRCMLFSFQGSWRSLGDRRIISERFPPSRPPVVQEAPNAGASRASLRGRLRLREVEEVEEQSLPLSSLRGGLPPNRSAGV